MTQTAPIEACGELLKSVSRSFYLSMVFLPKEMREGISIGYLLARASDSVADSSMAESSTRLKSLRSMQRVIASSASAEEQQHCIAELAGELADAQENPNERELLLRFADCLQALRARPDAEIELIAKVLNTIIEGQCWDLEYFATQHCVASEQESDEYCYRVAGCVGEFWTELGLLSLGEKFCPPARQDLMTEAGIRYGKGLQLVNILRDVQEDRQRGRQYLAQSKSAQQWMRRAERYLSDGIDYSQRLRSMRLRFCSMLPALLGLKTLRLLAANDATKQKLKITRSSVYLTMLQAALMSICAKRA